MTVGVAALVAPALHSITDLMEWYHGGFSSSQLWPNHIAFRPMTCYCQASRSIFFSLFYPYLTSCRLLALAPEMPDSRAWATRFCSSVRSHLSRFSSNMKIEIDDLSRTEIKALLNEHLHGMYELSPPESVHALDLEKLRAPDITFWTAWEGSLLLGCGALKELDPKHGEVKSMRTPNARRRQGAGRAILAHIVSIARSRGYERLSLETGSMDAFKPAHRLYESFGFTFCGPFGEYVEDPNSVFMTMRL
jgi:putative acetyltransferase